MALKGDVFRGDLACGPPLRPQQRGTIVAAVQTSEMGEEKAKAWRGTMADAVDLLLRQAERRLDQETQRAFGTRSPAAVFRLHTEQARVAELRERLRALR
jgi:hypothetical protein